MENKTLTPIQSIRKKCLDCVGNHPSLVRGCESVDCPLYQYRLGKNPNRQGIGGFKSFKKCLSLTGSENSSIGQGHHILASETQPIPPTKPFITNEMAEKMIKAATIIIDTTNTLKSSVA